MRKLNPVWVGLAVVFALALGGIYITLLGLERIEKDFIKTTEGLEANIRLLTLRTAPFIMTGASVGYVIEFENGTTFYFAGAAGLSADMKIIGDFYQPDVAFLPIGNFYTMDPKAAAHAAKLVNPTRYVVANHFASFPALVQEPDEFFNYMAKYELRAKPLRFEVGIEQEVMGVRVEWLGHSHWLFTSPEGTRILIDPAVEYNIPFPEKYRDLAQFERIDLILITHGHFHHIPLSDLRQWNKHFEPLYIANFELGIWLMEALDYGYIMAVNKGSNVSKAEMLRAGVPAEKVAGIADNIRIHMVPASHTSSITPEDLPPRRY